MSIPHTVIAVLEAKKGKEEELASALKSVVQSSRSESTCLEYRLHRSIENQSQFTLYENWVNKEKHQEQFTKPYIVELGKKLDDLIAKPCQIIFAEEIIG